MRIYRAYAIFNFAADGINVTFPELPGCVTCGYTLDEALYMAKEALELYIKGEPIAELPALASEMPELTDDKDRVYLIEANHTD
ncbi:type II toxin-antitoxin system HicB family antitoxin [Paenibacillus sp. ACRSA]|uniref:type II toxin-antitoxin system HicB family antitoxin n=1 Tax=Paenibacillus sp. ACRSA TaxID=2918211 RepID=UPI001EF62BA8|nr:type II toxin-antitoxin system HicB family antitoxin [Paenibacillus sp. ACRSA]MCG7376369.1 type II toxin-antitoxin system HicB family antitoxin [Paenibacillus sp. ACRSA]